jgi:hypothetical protein
LSEKHTLELQGLKECPNGRDSFEALEESDQKAVPSRVHCGRRHRLKEKESENFEKSESENQRRSEQRTKTATKIMG